MKKVITIFMILIMLSICTLTNATTEFEQQLTNALEQEKLLGDLKVQIDGQEYNNIDEYLNQNTTSVTQTNNAVANVSKIPNTGEKISISNILISVIVVSIIIAISLFIYNRKKMHKK